MLLYYGVGEKSFFLMESKKKAARAQCEGACGEGGQRSGVRAGGSEGRRRHGEGDMV